MQKVPALRRLGKAGGQGGEPSEVMAAGIPLERMSSRHLCLKDFRTPAARGPSGKAWRRSDTCSPLHPQSLLGGPGGGCGGGEGTCARAPSSSSNSSALPLAGLHPVLQGRKLSRRSGLGSIQERGPRQSVSHFPGSVLGVKRQSRQGQRRGSRRERLSELAAQLRGARGEWGGCAEPQPPSAAGPPWAPGRPSAHTRTPQLAGPRGQSSAPGGVARRARQVRRFLGGPPPRVHPRGRCGPSGSPGCAWRNAGAWRGWARRGLPGAWRAERHRAQPRARPRRGSRTCRRSWRGLEAAGTRGFPNSPEPAGSSLPFKQPPRSGPAWPRLHCGTPEARVGEVNAFREKPRLRRFAERGRSSWVVVNSVYFAGRSRRFRTTHTHTPVGRCEVRLWGIATTLVKRKCNA